LSQPQLARLAKAFQAIGPEGTEKVRDALYHVVSPHNRQQVNHIVLRNDRIGEKS